VLELISVHVPKCAGYAFRIALQAAYGTDSVHLDYGDRVADPASPMQLDPDGFLEGVRAGGYAELSGKCVVHGHFHIRKYRYLTQPARRITVLRHPVDRTVSNYNFWQTFKRHGHTLQNYMLDRRLSLIQFARLPYMRYFYERVYFAGIERSLFDYVGSVESLDRDLPALSELLGRPLALPRANVGAQRSESTATEQAEAREELLEILRDDIAFYRRWCER
jgi:hypothetical protein